MSYRQRRNVDLGSFVVGEIPPPLTYQFVDDDNLPINLTGFTTVAFNWSDDINGGVPLDSVAETGIITDAVNGEVEYAWDGDEFVSTGEHRGIFYVNDGTIQYASMLIIWQVCLGIGTVPPV